MNTTVTTDADVWHQLKLFEAFESVLDDPQFDAMVDRYASNILIAGCQQLQAAIDKVLARKGPVRKPIRPVCRRHK